MTDLCRGRHSHGAWVADTTAVVIKYATLHGSKYNLGHPYPDITSLLRRSIYPFHHIREVIVFTVLIS